MNKKLSFLPLLAVLAACAAGNILSYELEFATDDTERQANLTMAAVRTIERRLARYESAPLDTGINREGDQVFVSIEVEDSELASVLNEELTEPFVLEFMASTDNEEEIDVVVEGHGGFKSIGITGDTIDWLTAGEDPETSLGAIRITFKEDSVSVIQEVFSTYDGQFLGLFVRGQLAAKIEVQSELFEDVVVISGIPSVDVAKVFADDVNLGLYVTFVPVP